ncbi:MAG: hypothetical protein IT384_21275 [Deltaproteobacteria bacterium]|nr:hypothetical protein [Deltaproteobacteria bacterium]
MRPLCPRVGALLLLLPSAACASLISGRTQALHVRGASDARVYVDGADAGEAGSSVRLTRGRSHALRFEIAGEASQSVEVGTEMNPWVWGNLALGPLFFVGVLVDAISGAVSSLDRREIAIEAPSRGTLASRAGASALGAPPPAIAAREPDRRWVLAVMDLRASGEVAIPEATRLALGDQLRVFLAEQRVRVIDRGAQDAALRSLIEGAKAESYGPCVDESCQIPLGRALAATHLVRPGVARFGGTCSTHAELVDLKTEVTVAAAALRGDCSDEGLLNASAGLAEQLLQRASLAP